MNFQELLKNAKGHLEVVKLYDDHEEVVFSDHNVICSGLAANMAAMYSSSGLDVSSYQMNIFQLGEGTDATIGDTVVPNVLQTPLDWSSYGENALMALDKTTGTLQDLSDASLSTGEAFLVLPQTYVDKVNDSTVRWNLHVDENTANGQTLTEIGLFTNNPFEKDLTAEERITWICAYRFFGDPSTGQGIYKTQHFALVFKWTIQF
jgi:hypothetical protein